MMNDKLILGKDQMYDLDCYKTKVNNNVLVVGTAGSGKTTVLVARIINKIINAPNCNTSIIFYFLLKYSYITTSNF